MSVPSYNSNSLLLVSSYGPSLLNFRGHLLRHALSSGFDKVTVLAPSCDREYPFVEILTSWGIHVRFYPLQRTGLNPLRDIYAIYSLCRMILEVAPSHLLAYTVKPVLYCGVAINILRSFFRLSVPISYVPLISGLGGLFNSSNGLIGGFLVPRLVKSFYRFSLSGARDVIFQNSDDLQYFHSQRILSYSCLSHRVWGSGVDLDRFPFTPRPSSHVFLLLARIVKEKGILEFIEAASVVKSSFPSATFVVAGMADSRGKVDLLNRLKDDPNVVYHGELSDVTALLAAARYFVLPSYYREGVPRSLLEALSSGIPIITTDLPGCRDTVIDGWNGFLVPPRDSNSLAKLMIRMIMSSPDEIASMSRNSREHAVRHFDVNNVSSDIISVLLPTRIS